MNQPNPFANWQSMLYGNKTPEQTAASDNWWGDWYKKAVQSQEATNAMPFMFNPAKAGGAENTNPLGVNVDPAALKASMFTQPAAGGATTDPVAMRQQAAQEGGGLLQPGMAQAPQTSDLLQQLLGLSPEVLMPLLQQLQAQKGVQV